MNALKKAPDGLIQGDGFEVRFSDSTRFCCVYMVVCSPKTRLPGPIKKAGLSTVHTFVKNKHMHLADLHWNPGRQSQHMFLGQVLRSPLTVASKEASVRLFPSCNLTGARLMLQTIDQGNCLFFAAMSR